MSYSNVLIKLASEDHHVKQAKQVRIEVFVHEQKYPLETEFDEYDAISTHWVAYCDKEIKLDDGSVTIKKCVPVGTLRLIPNKPEQGVAKLGRLAVLSCARGLYIGQKLVLTFIEYCKEHGYKSIGLHSQCPKQGFYEKIGFKVEEGDGEPFDEDGTPHIRMWMRDLQKKKSI